MEQVGTPYPETAPFDTRKIDVGGGHTIYVEQAGDRDGLPVVFLHGGPGSGCQPGQRRLFDPQRFRAVFFDQRGAGRSTPRGQLEANDTDALIADMERIRGELGIERWMVVGGSWGATLAVAYAERFPARVSAIALRAVFLGTPEEVEWAFVRGPQTFRPDLWRSFVDLLPLAGRDDPLAAYGDMLRNPDPKVHGPAAVVWHDYERALSVLTPTGKVLADDFSKVVVPTTLPNTPFVESHYFANACFLRPRQLLDEASALKGIPGVIVQGRYDLLCPPVTAHALAAHWPDCEVRWVDGAGHSMDEAGVTAALMGAIESLPDRID